MKEILKKKKPEEITIMPQIILDKKISVSSEIYISTKNESSIKNSDYEDTPIGK